MAAVAEMGPGQSLGHNYIKWWANGMPIRVFFGPGLRAKAIDHAPDVFAIPRML